MKTRHGVVGWLVGLALALTFLAAAPAHAAPTFKAPFRCGEVWNAATYAGHGNAVDFATYSNGANVSRGRPVVASADGMVAERGYLSDGGNYVRIRHWEAGWTTYYGHLDSFAVSINQQVSAGTVIGYVGSTGYTLPAGFAHLHYQQEYNRVVQRATINGQAFAIGGNGLGADRPRVTSDNGCSPVIPDTDGDGVNDRDDACPTAPGHAVTNGCRPNSDGDGVPDWQDQVNDTDVNGDGLPDVVGFASAGVRVAINTGKGFAPSTLWIRDFGTEQGWQVDQHPRLLADMNGDGLPDIVGFGSGAIFVGINTGSSFTASVWIASFGSHTTAGAWNSLYHPRYVADMNADGLPDVVGFASRGVVVALNTGSSFKAESLWSGEFGVDAGWSVGKHPRTIADVNGDGLPDVVGFGAGGVRVALNTGTSLKAPTTWIADFGYDAGGWRTFEHPRMVVDVNADGRPDIVGFAHAGVFVSLNTGASFAASRVWSNGFGASSTAGGWDVTLHPRALADVNGDGRPDIVGFGSGGTQVALNTGSAFTYSGLWSSQFGLHDVAGAWRYYHPRTLVDINGDRRPDVVGFSGWGVATALNSGTAFGANATWSTEFGRDASGGSWSDLAHIRAIGLDRLAGPRPKVSGTAKVGSTLTAQPGTWRPGAVTLKYQWFASGIAISGATKSTFVVTATQLGKTITVKVTGSKSGFGSLARSSTATATIAPGTLTAPVPKITGTARVGSKLTAAPGTWTTGTTLTYQWYASGTAISGATASTFTPGAAQLSKPVTLKVTGKKTGYTTASKTSGATAKLAVGVLTTGSPTISGTGRSGQTLTAKPGTWTSGTVLKYQWFASGKAISGATATTLKLSAVHVGKTISFKVTGTKAAYTTVTKSSPATKPIAKG